MILWLAFRPKYTTQRYHATPVGAHAFDEGEDKSLCRLVERRMTTGIADADARKCTHCARLVAGGFGYYG